MIVSGFAKLSADALRGLAALLLWFGDLATPVLFAARWCEDRAREWNPRLWERNGDLRSDNRERRP